LLQSVPELEPYTPDANTLLLEHFDGTTSGSVNGDVSYATGVFGQGVHMIDTAWISYSLGALPQGTFEFWAKLDDLSNSSGNPPGLFGSFYSQFYAGTSYMLVVPVSGSNGEEGQPNGGVNIAPFNWNHAPAHSAVITPDRWHHYALTWGNAGLHLYLDGSLIASNSNPGGQNLSTGWWAVGVNGSSAIGAPGQGFNGIMDELRISNIQRTFEPTPPR
jgi:hypothetical protein